jgi:hypothetical protein
MAVITCPLAVTPSSSNSKKVGIISCNSYSKESRNNYASHKVSCHHERDRNQHFSLWSLDSEEEVYQNHQYYQQLLCRPCRGSASHAPRTTWTARIVNVALLPSTIPIRLATTLPDKITEWVMYTYEWIGTRLIRNSATRFCPAEIKKKLLTSDAGEDVLQSNSQLRHATDPPSKEICTNLHLSNFRDFSLILDRTWPHVFG